MGEFLKLSRGKLTVKPAIHGEGLTKVEGLVMNVSVLWFTER